MKFGMRKSSIRKSISARTKGKAKREIKRILIPGSHNPKVTSPNPNTPKKSKHNPIEKNKPII